MGKQTSIETRKIIVDLKNKGKSLREIGEIVGRNHCTVKKYWTNTLRTSNLMISKELEGHNG